MHHGPNQEEEKLLISRILSTEGQLNLLYQKQPLIFSEIIKVFNIVQTRQTLQSLFKLKQRLINICLQQKQQFLEYLSLPKFRQVSQHALELLKLSLQQIASQIKKQQENVKMSTLVSRLSRYIPKLNTLSEYENYHLKVFEIYAQSEVCPYRNQYIETLDKSRMIEMSPQHYQENAHYVNFVKSLPHQQKTNEYPGFWMPFSTPQDRNSSQIFQNPLNKFTPYNQENSIPSEQLIHHPSMSNIPPVSHNSCPSFKNQLKLSKRQSSQLIDDYSPTSIVKRQKQEESSRFHCVNQEIEQPQSHVSEHKHKIFNAVDPNFKNCVCKGKIQKVGQQQFLCDSCMGKFHFQCLKITFSQQVEHQRKCPICVVEQVQNSFFEIIKPPLISSWIVHNKQNTTPHAIRFTQNNLNEMRKILSKPDHKVYLQLITITKRVPLSKQSEPKTQSKHIVSSSCLVSSECDEQKDMKQESRMEQQKDENKKPIPCHKVESCQSTELRKSIQFTQKYINELSKVSSPVLSLNFGYSPQYEHPTLKIMFDEQRTIYFGIYHFKKKSASQVMQELIPKLGVPSVIQSEMESRPNQRLLNLVKNKLLEKMTSKNSQQKNEIKQMREQNKAIQQATKLKILIDSNSIKASVRSTRFDQKNQKVLYPFRFTNCSSLEHVFQLQCYLENLHSQSKQYKSMLGSLKLSPDTNINVCPLCLVQGANGKNLSKTQKSNQQQSRNEQKSIYLDQTLYYILNNRESRQEISKIYSSPKQSRVEIEIRMKIKCHVGESEVEKQNKEIFIQNCNQIEYHYELHISENLIEEQNNQLPVNRIEQNQQKQVQLLQPNKINSQNCIEELQKCNGDPKEKGISEGKNIQEQSFSHHQTQNRMIQESNKFPISASDPQIFSSLKQLQTKKQCSYKDSLAELKGSLVENQSAIQPQDSDQKQKQQKQKVLQL